jgi:hypothetical protein
MIIPDSSTVSFAVFQLTGKDSKVLNMNGERIHFFL